MSKTLVIEYFSSIEDTLINQVINKIENAVMEGVKRVVILISSTGGSTAAGIKAYNYLRSMNEKIQIITYNVGYVESAAISLYCAGAKRYAVPISHFLIHQSRRSYSSYTPQQIKTAIKAIKEDNKNSIDIIKNNVVQSNRKVQDGYYSGITLSPEEAKQWGLINATTSGIDDNFFNVIGGQYEYFWLYRPEDNS